MRSDTSDELPKFAEGSTGTSHAHNHASPIGETVLTHLVITTRIAEYLVACIPKQIALLMKNDVFTARSAATVVVVNEQNSRRSAPGTK
jgi:hypothetical protein